MSDSVASASSRPAKVWAWRFIKWGLCLLVLWFVGRRGYQLWQEADWNEIPFNAGWLVLAGVCYSVGWLPSVWFWRRMMEQVGGNIGFPETARAYYCGHLGKYVPGKATVLVIRSGLLKGRVPVAIAVLTATCETLMMMATGAAVAVALSPWLIDLKLLESCPAWVRQIVALKWLPGVIVIAVCLVLVRIIATLLTMLALKFAPKEMSAGERRVHITPALVLQGLGAFAGSWFLHGLSLACTLKSVGGALKLTDFPMWVGGVSAATSAGFIALFAPGGLGVREGILLEVLRIQPHISPAQAVAVPVLLRAVWFLSEVAAAAVSYFGFRGTSVSKSASEESTIS